MATLLSKSGGWDEFPSALLTSHKEQDVGLIWRFSCFPSWVNFTLLWVLHVALTHKSGSSCAIDPFIHDLVKWRLHVWLHLVRREKKMCTKNVCCRNLTANHLLKMKPQIESHASAVRAHERSFLSPLSACWRTLSCDKTGSWTLFGGPCSANHFHLLWLHFLCPCFCSTHNHTSFDLVEMNTQRIADEPS